MTLTVASGELDHPEPRRPAVRRRRRRARNASGWYRARKGVDTDQALAGYVINSDPEANTKVPKGSTVTLDVAQTPGVDVPDVAGKTAARSGRTS